ncbi:CBS domain-containing protein [Defluviitalea phaphyphila]|uniref:CBS domain-containing protein n=1 Tax=Defluviitalea phaphyphila TaxID=1473580 RepID=UPI000730D01F|nr:CBS domain-containing protein [Defluviitalea phaphyphila]
MTAKDIMQRNVLYIKKDMLIKDIAKLLFENKISGVPVVDDDKKVIGIVTEKDLLTKDKNPRFPSYVEFLGSIIFLEGVKRYDEELRKLAATKAEEIMTKKVHTIKEDTSIEEIASIMVEERVNRVPVVDEEGRLIGIVSRADMLKTIL